jgi:hypothetical protein
MSYRWMTRINGKGAKVGMPFPILISRLLIYKKIDVSIITTCLVKPFEGRNMIFKSNKTTLLEKRFQKFCYF